MLKNLTDGLLQLSRFKKINSLEEKISVKEIVEAAIKQIKPLAEKKKIAIKTKVAKIEARGNRSELTQLFAILLDNAVKYSHKKGKVEVVGQEGKIVVQDYGAGIAEEDLPHVFERFFRGGKSRISDGFGLGLSIAKEIVTAC